MFELRNKQSHTEDDRRVCALQEEIRLVRGQREDAEQRHKERLLSLYGKLRNVERRFKMAKDAVLDENVPLYKYTEHFRASSRPSYLVRTEAQLLRHVHAMGTLVSLKELTIEQGNDEEDILLNSIENIKDQKTEVQLRMMTAMVHIVSKIKEIEASYETTLSSQSEMLRIYEEAENNIERTKETEELYSIVSLQDSCSSLDAAALSNLEHFITLAKECAQDETARGNDSLTMPYIQSPSMIGSHGLEKNHSVILPKSIGKHWNTLSPLPKRYFSNTSSFSRQWLHSNVTPMSH